jgi:hypothetical protein
MHKSGGKEGQGGRAAGGMGMGGMGMGGMGTGGGGLDENLGSDRHAYRLSQATLVSDGRDRSSSRASRRELAPQSKKVLASGKGGAGGGGGGDRSFGSSRHSSHAAKGPLLESRTQRNLRVAIESSGAHKEGRENEDEDSDFGDFGDFEGGEGEDGFQSEVHITRTVSTALLLCLLLLLVVVLLTLSFYATNTY